MNILLVEDDKIFADKCIKLLINNKYYVYYTQNVINAKLILQKEQIDIIIIDLMLPPTYLLEGLELSTFVNRKYPDIIIILMTSKKVNTIEIVSSAMNNGANYFFEKDHINFEDKLILKIKEIIMEQQNTNVFISHGHNEFLSLKLKNFLAFSLKKNPIILSEQPNQGLTIVEKLEKISTKCNFAIILMTKDDEQSNGNMRARQNVIHEIGFFQGRYGRNKVLLLAEKGTEIFSNISGILRIDFESNNFETIFEFIRNEIEST